MNKTVNMYLDDKGSIVGSASSEPVLETRPVFIAVLDLLCKQLGVEHGCVAQVGTIATTQHSPSQLRLINLFRDQRR